MIYTPKTLAAEWGCSERHVRNLINRGQLRAFRLGGKLLRIPAEAVREVEQCPAIALDASKDNSSSSSSTKESVADSGLMPRTQARLVVLRRESSQS
jgi:excisionase family DNA binding protein